MRTFLFTFFSFLTVCAAGQSTSQESDSRDATPKYVNDFLNIGAGARSMGMGNVGVASVNDVTAGYWNPAGLTGIQSDLQLAGLHAIRFANINKYDYAAIGKGIDSTSAIAFSLIRSGVDDIPNTLELRDADGNIDYDRITLFSAVDYAFIVSYARGFGLDAGLHYQCKKWQLGLSARDITTTVNAWNYSLTDDEVAVLQSTGNEIPENSLEITLPRFIFGVARQWDFKKNISVLAEGNLDITTDGERNTVIAFDPISIDPRLGLELGYKETIYVRGGISSQQFGGVDGEQSLVMQPTMGIGLRIRSIYLDYALTVQGDDSSSSTGNLNSNVFSLKINLFKQQ